MTAPTRAASNPAATFRPAAPVVAKAVVIGAGAMGSGIAAQFANAGVPVVLLDLPAEGDDPRATAKAGVANQLKAGGFMRPDVAGLVTAGTTDELELVADADWIIEAVVERLEVKQELFRRLEAVRKDGSIVSSNTSTLPRRDMVAGLPERFARDFVVVHFFNPPRVMRLVELVGGPEVPPALLDRVTRACEDDLGKTVVVARDTPGFIANRVGCYWMAMAASEAIAAGLDVETADAILAGVAATPKTGVFGLFDLIGLDLVPLIWGSLYAALPADDPLHAFDLRRSPVFEDMLANRRFGRKTKAGFYRLAADRSREAWDHQARAYRPERRQPKYGPDLFDRQDAEGRFARRVVAQTAAYAARVGAEIAEDHAAVDTAMALGYAWSRGPFALAAQVGEARIANWLRAENLPVPPLLDQPATKTTGGAGRATTAAPAPVIANADAAVFELGDEVACLELRTKMNVFTPAVFDLIHQAVALTPGRFRGLVITGAGPRAYSAGADLKSFLERTEAGDFAGVEAFVKAGQTAFQALKHAPFPVVGAAFGLALGGGCESLLHSDAIVAHAELNAGLPETKVGLIPGWGGCTLMLARALASGASLEEAAVRVFDPIFEGRVSSSALDAAALGVLRPGDWIVMNPARLRETAKAKVLALAQAGYAAPAPERLPAGGAALRDRLLARLEERSELSAYDRVIAGRLAHILAGGDRQGWIGEAEMLELEREALVALVRNPETGARIAHMLSTGKPLRN